MTAHENIKQLDFALRSLANAIRNSNIVCNLEEAATILQAQDGAWKALDDNAIWLLGDRK